MCVPAFQGLGGQMIVENKMIFMTYLQHGSGDVVSYEILKDLAQEEFRKQCTFNLYTAN